MRLTITRVRLDSLFFQLPPILLKTCIGEGSFGVRARANFGQFFPTRRAALPSRCVMPQVRDAQRPELGERSSTPSSNSLSLNSRNAKCKGLRGSAKCVYHLRLGWPLSLPVLHSIIVNHAPKVTPEEIWAHAKANGCKLGLLYTKQPTIYSINRPV